MSARVDGAANKARRSSTPQAPEGGGRGRRGGGAGGPLGGSAVHYETKKKREKRGKKEGRAGGRAGSAQRVSNRLICMPAFIKKKKKSSLLHWCSESEVGQVVSTSGGQRGRKATRQRGNK